MNSMILIFIGMAIYFFFVRKEEFRKLKSKDMNPAPIVHQKIFPERPKNGRPPKNRRPF